MENAFYVIGRFVIWAGACNEEIAMVNAVKEKQITVMENGKTFQALEF